MICELLGVPAQQHAAFEGWADDIGLMISPNLVEHLDLFMLVTAANSDPAVFGDTSFDITATRPAQLTFGGGIHHCLGAFLARAELAEALPVLARRLRNPQLSAEPQWRPAIGIAGPVTLRMRFTPQAAGL